MQQCTISVSKGCFVFKNDPTTTAANRRKSNSRRSSKPSASSLLSGEHHSERWYKSFRRTWLHIHSEHDRLQTVGYAHTLAYLRNFITTSSAYVDGNRNQSHDDGDGDPNLPTVALLTGINQPDHVQLFRTFAGIVRRELRSHVCVLQSMECPNMKATIESMVCGLMTTPEEEEDEETKTTTSDEDNDIDNENEDNLRPNETKRWRRSQYTMAVLKAWYTQRYGSHGDTKPATETTATGRRPILTVIVPDFENFQRDVLAQFILLLGHNCRRLPIVLVLGVATDLATLHRTLSFADTSRLSLQVSQSQPSAQILSKILDEIVLTPNCAVSLSARVFTLLTDIFLYYDLSINSFMQGFKYCIMEHYGQGNAFSVCSANASDIEQSVRQLTADDFDTIRRLPSFRPYVESLAMGQHVVAVLTDDEALRGQLKILLADVRAWLRMWYGSLRVLAALVQELPRTQLGKQLRDLYAKCASSGVAIVDSPDFIAAWDLLAIMSKDELIDTLTRSADALQRYAAETSSSDTKNNSQMESQSTNDMANIVGELHAHVRRIRQAGNASATSDGGSPTRPSTQSASSTEAAAFDGRTKVLSRQDMQARVLQMSRQPKAANAYQLAVAAALCYVRDNVLARHLQPFSNGPPLLELFVFGDVAAVRSHIVGAPRAALHTALHNPHAYMQCECCRLDDDSQMSATLPDLSAVYKLHLESGHQINLYDWMQAFRAVVEPLAHPDADTDNDDDEDDDEDDKQPISAQLQARFTRAVAELQFLGFIKSSKRKTDHVTRLTW